MVATRKITTLIVESALKGQSVLIAGQWQTASRLASNPATASRLLIVSRGFVSQTSKDLRPANALFNSQIGGSQSNQILTQSSTSSPLGQPGSVQPRQIVNITNKLQLRYSNSNLTTSSRPLSNIGAQQDHAEEKDNTAVATNQEQRPLAVLMVWLMANEKNVEKYRQLYLRRGFDVLTVKTTPLDLLFPQNGGKKVAESIVHFLNGTAIDYEKIVVHLFSVGAYQFSEVMLNLLNQEKSEQLIQEFRRRIKGLIMDSPVDLHGAPHGVAKSVFPNNPYMLKLVEWLLDAYLIRFERGTSKHLRIIQNTFYKNPLKLPSLVLASEKDPIANPDYLAPFLGHWRAAQVPLEMQTWNDTQHVAHYVKYPTEYEQLVERFLRKVKVL